MKFVFEISLFVLISVIHGTIAEDTTGNPDPTPKILSVKRAKVHTLATSNKDNKYGKKTPPVKVTAYTVDDESEGETDKPEVQFSRLISKEKDKKPVKVTVSLFEESKKTGLPRTPTVSVPAAVSPPPSQKILLSSPVAYLIPPQYPTLNKLHYQTPQLNAILPQYNFAYHVHSSRSGIHDHQHSVQGSYIMLHHPHHHQYPQSQPHALQQKKPLTSDPAYSGVELEVDNQNLLAYHPPQPEIQEPQAQVYRHPHHPLGYYVYNHAS